MRTPRRRTSGEGIAPRRRSSNGTDIDTSDIDIADLLKDSSSIVDDNDDTNLESIFRRKINNPFNTPNTMAKLAAKSIAEEKELEELSRADNSKIFVTGYSIHLLTPYIILITILCIGFMVVDSYFFNIIELLSEDIRYKISAYGVFILFSSILIYFFIRRCLDYTSFEMVVTKYKIVQGSKRTTVKNELPYYSIQEIINDRGFFGRILNYGELSLYLMTRRTVKFEKLHGAQYVYDIVQRLKYGKASGYDNDDEISQIINGAEKIEKLNKDRQKEEVKPFSVATDMKSLGFTEEEMIELGMLGESLSTNSRNRRSKNTEDSEPDTLELDVDNKEPAPKRRSRR